MALPFQGDQSRDVGKGLRIGAQPDSHAHSVVFFSVDARAGVDANVPRLAHAHAGERVPGGC